MKQQRAKNDYSDVQKSRVEDLALAHLDDWVPNKIVDKVFGELSEIDPDFQGLKRQQLVAYVYHIRYQNSGGNSIQTLEHMHIGNDSASWVRASSVFVDKDGQQRCIMFSDPKLLYHLKQSKVRKKRYPFFYLSLNHILLSLCFVFSCYICIILCRFKCGWTVHSRVSRNLSTNA